MAEQVEKHGDVQIVVGRPRLMVSAGEVCPRCQLVVQEHRFFWPKPDANLAPSLFVEACYCGVRFTDPGSQRMDETPQLWGDAAQEEPGTEGFYEPEI